MTQTLRFLLALEGLGLAGLPLASRALGRLPGAGLGLARILAWLLLAWLVWIAGSLGVPNGAALAVGAAAALAAAAVAVHRRREGASAPDPFRRRLWIWSEILFVVAFLAAVVVGSYSADVWGTEKPMDMMLANATLTSDAFPPHDPWLSGADVNYYYLGQHMVALMIRLTGVEPTQGYNLALAAIFAVTVTAAFTVAATIAEAARRQGLPVRRPLGAGAACVALLALMGNLRGGWAALHADKLTTFDWFAPSRVIANTINEFPFFSWTVGDLHAHVIAIPLSLLALAFVVQAGLGGPPPFVRVSGWWETFCAALSVGWLYAVNSWSWPVMAGLLVLTVAVWITSPDASRRRTRAVAWTIGVLVLGAVLVLPFVVSFEPNAGGVGLTRQAQRESFAAFVKHHLVIEGVLLWLLLAPLLARLRGLRHPLRWLVWGAGSLVVGLLSLAPERLAGAGILAVLVVVALVAALAGRLRNAERVLWVIAATALACLFGAEVGVVKDEFLGGPYERMNTVFKLGYQAWILLAVFGAVALSAARAWLPLVPRLVWLVGAAGLIGVSLAYPVAGTYARKAGFTDGPRLDGRHWLASTAPGDVAAIDWIRAHTPGDAVVLEAVGDDYSPFGNARVSTYTGRPTVLGWQGHELQWNHRLGDRRADVETLYKTPDALLARTLLDRYRVAFAVVGPLERTTYGAPVALARAGREVFARDGTAIYAFTVDKAPPGKPIEHRPPVLGG